MESSASSLMVVLEGEEYCFLYDPPSFPDVIESLIQGRRPPEETEPGFLDSDRAHEIARALIGRNYQEL